MRRHSLGNQTNKAWLAGFDAAIAGLARSANPYKREPQVRAWERGWWTGYWGEEAGVRTMKRIANRVRPGSYLEVA